MFSTTISISVKVDIQSTSLSEREAFNDFNAYIPKLREAIVASLDSRQELTKLIKDDKVLIRGIRL